MSHQLRDRIRDHADALEEVAPPIALADVCASTRHSSSSRSRRSLLAVAAVAMVVVGGLVAIDASPRTDPSQSGESGTPDEPSTETQLDASIVPGYHLDLADATPTIDDQQTASTANGAVWTDARTETYLTLTVRAGLAATQPSPTGLGPMRQLDDFPSELGRAWITDIETEESQSPVQLRMWWTRPDGDVWLLTSYWYQPDGLINVDAAVSATTTWAADITATSDADTPYDLDDTVADSDMELVFTERGSEIRSRRQVWRVDDSDVTLVTTQQATASGLRNLLDAGVPAATVIAGRPGWIVSTASGETVAGWWSDGPPQAWTTITIPAELAERSDEILDSLSADDVPDDPGSAPQPSTREVSPTTNPPVELWTELVSDAAMTMPDAPLSGRVAPAGVWTGTELIIWAGAELDTPSGEIPLDDGAAFNPTTGTWRVIAAAPIEGRSYPGAVWTGQEMIVWGGSDNGQTLDDGAAYDPATDTWRTLPTAPLDSAMKVNAMWTGDEVIMLGGMRSVSSDGGQSIRDGAAYNPATNQWRALPPLPGISLMPYPTAVWTGTAVITSVATDPNGAGFGGQVQRLRYRPGDSSWEVIDDDATAIFLVATPALDGDVAAVALPSEAEAPVELLDRNGDLVADANGRPRDLGGGGNYALPAWTGSEILFWSGNELGWAFTPATGRWRTFPAGNVANRVDGSVVWADGVMLSWGGFVFNRDGSSTGGDDGIIYRPPGD